MITTQYDYLFTFSPILCSFMSSVLYLLFSFILFRFPIYFLCDLLNDKLREIETSMDGCSIFYSSLC